MMHLIVPAALAAILTAAWFLSYRWLNKEVAAALEVHNPGGDTGTALVVYHPGPGTFHRRVVGAFAEGLVAGGWQVEVATASAQVSTVVAGHDLLVLGSPTYWFAPSLPIQRTVKHLGSRGGLDGQPTVTIITGLGAGERASNILRNQVRKAGGSLVRSLTLYRLRPNDDENYGNGTQNRALAVEMARQAARSLTPTAE